MYYSTTDGKESHIPDQCSCCNLNTAGEHEGNCPLFVEKSYHYVWPLEANIPTVIMPTPNLTWDFISPLSGWTPEYLPSTKNS